MKLKMKAPVIAIISAGVLAGVSLAIPAPAQAESGFFQSLRKLFTPQRRTRTKPQQQRRKRSQPSSFGLPRVTFSYAHQNIRARHRRFHYSHHTPYGYTGHPYRHGFAYVAPAAKPRTVRRKSPSNVRRQEFRFTRDGRVIRLF